MTDSMLKAWGRRFVGTVLPPAIRRQVRRSYYGRLAASFSPEQWPYSAAVARLVRPGDCVVDAGANIGCITKLLAGWVGPSGSVYSFEPVFDTFDLLDSNVRRLHLANVRASRIALSSENRTGTMGVPSYAAGGSNLYESRVIEPGTSPSFARTEPVTLRTLDSLFGEGRESPSFVKIDVEGHELDVVRGAVELIRRNRPAMLIEITGSPDEPDAPAARLVALLESFGYTPFQWEVDQLRPRSKDESAADLLFLQRAHLDRFGSPFSSQTA